jgi:hypothetical protein
MGVVIAIAAIAAAALVTELITEAILKDLQNQIQKIKNSHKSSTDTLQNLQNLLSKIDFTKIYNAINKMSQEMGAKFK